MTADLFGETEHAPPTYTRTIMRSGASHVHRYGDPGGINIPHDNRELLRWMGYNGYTCIEEIPARYDHRPPEACDRCGSRGVEVHHTAPREWFGEKEAEEWPTQNLCRPCHRRWHDTANRAAAKTTVRILRSKGLDWLASKIEDALG